jgi:hypothetical protein
MANWQAKIGIILISLYVLLKQTLKEGKVLRMDEATVQVMGEEGRKDTQKSYVAGAWRAAGEAGSHIQVRLFPQGGSFSGHKRPAPAPSLRQSA